MAQAVGDGPRNKCLQSFPVDEMDRHITVPYLAIVADLFSYVVFTA
jgi:hypothetical protein